MQSVGYLDVQVPGANEALAQTSRIKPITDKRQLEDAMIVMKNSFETSWAAVDWISNDRVPLITVRGQMTWP